MVERYCKVTIGYYPRSGSVAAGAAVEWSPDSSIKLPAARLWHVNYMTQPLVELYGSGMVVLKVSRCGIRHVAPGVKPALYTMLTELSVRAVAWLLRPKVIPHHETFSTIIQPPYSSTKG